MFCIECGTKLEPNQKFCKNCGAPIKKQPQPSTKVYNQNSTRNSNDSNLIKAFKRRQEDTGWGWSMAHAIPFANTFVAIFYAISRRTITPLLIYFPSCFVLGFITAIFSYELSQDNGYATVMALLLAPPTTKIGISKARRYAKRRLDEIE